MNFFPFMNFFSPFYVFYELFFLMLLLRYPPAADFRGGVEALLRVPPREVRVPGVHPGHSAATGRPSQE